VLRKWHRIKILGSVANDTRFLFEKKYRTSSAGMPSKVDF
jgi:hypothetical protein